MSSWNPTLSLFCHKICEWQDAACSLKDCMFLRCNYSIADLWLALHKWILTASSSKKGALGKKLPRLRNYFSRIIGLDYVAASGVFRWVFAVQNDSNPPPPPPSAHSMGWFLLLSNTMWVTPSLCVHEPALMHVKLYYSAFGIKILFLCKMLTSVYGSGSLGHKGFGYPDPDEIWKASYEFPWFVH